MNSSHESSDLPQIRAEFDGREMTDLDLSRQRECAAGAHSEESPEILSMNVTQPEPLELERGQASWPTGAAPTYCSMLIRKIG